MIVLSYYYKKEYLPALDGLNGFSHIIVTWWLDKLDSEEIRSIKVLDKPYKCGPESIGVLATRSPVRPNPIAISVVKVEDLNVDNGVIKIEHIDAEDNSPILDIKPYYPNSDKVKHPTGVVTGRITSKIRLILIGIVK